MHVTGTSLGSSNEPTPTLHDEIDILDGTRLDEANEGPHGLCGAELPLVSAEPASVQVAIEVCQQVAGGQVALAPGSVPVQMVARTIPRLVVQVCASHGTRVLELLQEAEGINAAEVVFDLSEAMLSEEFLPRIAAVLKSFSSCREVKVCGLPAAQIRLLAGLGVRPNSILIGRFSRRSGI